MALTTNNKNHFGLGLNLPASKGSIYGFAFLSLLLALVIIYSNSFNGGWHFDDHNNIFGNKNIELSTLSWQEISKTFYGRHLDHSRISRPFSFLTFGLNYLVGGYGVFGYHLVNFFIHYLSGVFLFLFLFNTLQLPLLKERYSNHAYSIALLAVFLWATHPIQISAVTYIVQRMASLAGLFSIMTMYFYLKARTASAQNKRLVFFPLGGLTALLAFASKENAAMLPVILWLYDLFLIQGVNTASVKKNLKIAVLPLAIMVLLGILYGQGGSLLSGFEIRPFTLTERLLTEPRVLLKYLSLLLYPLESRLSMFHDIAVSTNLFSPWTTLPSIVIVFGCMVLGLLLSRRSPLLAYCVVFYFLNHLIEGSIIPLELIYEHRNYLPSMLFFVLPALLIINVLDYFSYKRSIQYFMALIFSLVMAVQAHTSYARNRVFSNDFIFWLDITAKAPGLSRPHNNLGTYYWNRGYDEKSSEQFILAILLNNSVSIREPAIYHENLAYYYLKKKEYDLARQFLLESSRINVRPTVRTLYGLSLALYETESYAKARFFVEQAIEVAPDKAELHVQLGHILLKERDWQGAAEAAHQALRLNPDNSQALFILGESNQQMNNYNEPP
jgi:tetratricopeptide (TPR) repeat protein